MLNAKTRPLAALDQLLAIAPAVETAVVLPMTAEEIEAEFDARRLVSLYIDISL